MYGSVACGQAGPESDVDVLVVFDRVQSLRDRLDAAGIVHDVHDVRLETDVRLEAQVLDGPELEFLRRTEAGLALNLDRDGIAV